MKILAVTAGLVLLLWSGGSQGYAVVAGLLGFAVWLLDVSLFPMGKCSRCEHGRQHSPLGGGFRPCRACGGAGVRPKWGARMGSRGGKS
ncbi:MAG: hypothetical protein ACRDQX_12980 [Pseudonocardiaceae bacterium]